MPANNHYTNWELKKTVTFWVRYFFVVKLPCVCSVIDHRWRQNVVRTEKWHTRRNRVCHWCSYHILTSSVIYYWIRRTATWNLFVLYNNEKPFAPPLQEKKPKKPFDAIYDPYKMKQFHWLLCVTKNCDWSRKIAPLSNLTQAGPLLVEWKLTAKAELNCEIYKSWRKCWKIKSVFVIGAALWALPWKLQELKKCPRKTVNLEAIWFEFWMKGA